VSDKKIIAVVGATGAQGGGLVRAIVADSSGPFVARAITRNPGSDKAKELAALGVEVVTGDADDEKSMERAFHGAYGAFCVTNFWEHMSPEREIAQATAMAEAAKASGIQHAIWSTLEDSRKYVPLHDDRMPTLHGKWKVPHFDAKGVGDESFRKAGVPTTFLLTSFYWDNLIHFGMGPRAGEDGTLGFVLPMGDRKLPGIAASDIGVTAYAIFKAGKEYIGKTVGISGEHLTGAEMAAQMSAVLGREVKHVSVPHDVYRTFDFPGADDLGNMFQFNHDFAEQFREARDVESSRRLNPSMQTFSQWLAQNAHRIPLG
jgi:uncharacterized protein YbjT (DUF2867 family)